jgi:hypothetical protein
MAFEIGTVHVFAVASSSSGFNALRFSRRFAANLIYKPHFIEKINRKSNCYRFIDVHDTNVEIRAGVLYAFDKRPYIHVISICSPFML